MKKVFLPILLVVLALIVIVGGVYSNYSGNGSLNGQCQKFGDNYYKDNKLGEIFKNDKIKFFYSKRLDTCLMTRVNELENDYSIADIQWNYIYHDLADVRNAFGIFNCDKDGIDNLILEKAEQYNGKLFNVSYEKYLDNGEGGEPRTIKTPEGPYTREKCKEFFDKKMEEIE